HRAPQRSFFAAFPGTLRRVSDLSTCSDHSHGNRPMPKKARKIGLGEARLDRSHVREKHAFDLGERWLGPANKLDYVIRRRIIPDHPCDNDRAFGRAPPFRSSEPARPSSWEFARMTLHPAATRGNSVLNAVQAAIGRCLSAEYDLSEPI